MRENEGREKEREKDKNLERKREEKKGEGERSENVGRRRRERTKGDEELLKAKKASGMFLRKGISYGARERGGVRWGKGEGK